MKNPLHSQEWSFAKVLLALWIIFSIFYVVNDVKKTVVVGVYKTGVQEGQKQGQQQGVQIGQRAAAQEIIVQLIGMGQRCEPINIYAGEGEARQEANLLGVQCEAPGVAKPGYTIPETPVAETEEAEAETETPAETEEAEAPAAEETETPEEAVEETTETEAETAETEEASDSEQ